MGTGLFVACFLSKVLVFAPGEYVLHERGSVDGFDVIQQQYSLIPNPVAERRCLAITPPQASALLHSLRRGDSCTMENQVITCDRPRLTWVL